METIQVADSRGGFASTERVDFWWVAPLATAIGLVVFFGYLTFRAFYPIYVYSEPYISPAVAPPVLTAAPGYYPGSVPPEHAWFGAFPAWWPWFVPTTPAIFLPALAILFRMTCYYYRGAYYKAFALRPANCAVRARTSPTYRGERKLLAIQNLHRYTLYGALLLLVFLWWEGLAAFFKHGEFGIGVGTVVMLMNAALLTGYTFGCHSWRHLIGGRLDCFSCEGRASSRYGMWKGSTWLNERHQRFAWFSLVWVCFTDFYVYLVATGTIRDLNTWSS